jgi:hypothetical protein
MTGEYRNPPFPREAVMRFGGAGRQRFNAAQVNAARVLQAARGLAGQTTEATPLLDRCDGLLHSARVAADSRSWLLAWHCLYQVERELVGIMNEDERRAAAHLYRAEAESLEPWRRMAARSQHCEADCSVATVQTLMRNVHDARIERLSVEAAQRGQISVLASLLAFAVVCVGAWGLVGGLDWILQSDVDVTLAMLLVNGMIFGFLGALLSSALRPIRLIEWKGAPSARRARIVTLARPLIGAIAAIPIAFLLQSDLINMGDASPVVDLLICFAAGFVERGFAAQIERAG